MMSEDQRTILGFSLGCLSGALFALLAVAVGIVMGGCTGDDSNGWDKPVVDGHEVACRCDTLCDGDRTVGPEQAQGCAPDESLESLELALYYECAPTVAGCRESYNCDCYCWRGEPCRLEE